MPLYYGVGFRPPERGRCREPSPAGHVIGGSTRSEKHRRPEGAVQRSSGVPRRGPGSFRTARRGPPASYPPTK